MHDVEVEIVSGVDGPAIAVLSPDCLEKLSLAGQSFSASLPKVGPNSMNEAALVKLSFGGGRGGRH